MGERSMSTFRRFVQDDSGATAIEYGLIAALVSVAIIVALGTLGNNLGNTFNNVADALEGASEAVPPSP
jgi:pilus assembly protein Flp/PilA